MSPDLSSSIQGILQASKQLRVTSQNIANINSKGYKSYDSKVVNTHSQLPSTYVSINNRIGSLHETKNNSDIVISNDGFFQVEDKGGKTFYRSGDSLSLSAEGLLQDSQGNKVLGQTSPIQSNNPFSINSDGSITSVGENGELINHGKLQISNFQNPQGLNSHGHGMYTPTNTSGVQGNLVSENAVISGYQEGSNVELAKEMTDMITGEKFLQSNVRAIKTQDEMLGDIIDLLS